MSREPKGDFFVRGQSNVYTGFLQVKDGKVRLQSFDPEKDLAKSFIFAMKQKNKKKPHYFLKHQTSGKFIAMPHIGNEVVVSNDKFEMSLIDMSGSNWKFVGHKSRCNLSITSDADGTLQVAEHPSADSLLSFSIVSLSKDSGSSGGRRAHSMLESSSFESESSSQSYPAASHSTYDSDSSLSVSWTPSYNFQKKKKQRDPMIGCSRSNSLSGPSSSSSSSSSSPSLKRVESASALSTKEDKPESSLMLSAHAVAADLLTQADVFLVSSPTRYKQRWLGIDRNFVMLTKTSNGDIIPIVDTMTCGSSMGSRQWIGAIGCHLFHFTITSSIAEYEFATPEESILRQFLNTVNRAKEKGKEKEAIFDTLRHKDIAWTKNGGGLAIWKKKTIVIDGCVMGQLSLEKQTKGKGKKPVKPDASSAVLKGVYINMLDVASIVVPTNVSDKKFQIRITAKNGLFKFAFDTQKQLTEWKAKVESVRMNSLSLRAVQAKKDKEEEVKSAPSSASPMEVEEPLEKRCSEEEIQWGVHYNVHHHLLQCCVFGELDMITYLIKHRGADPEYVLPHMPEGNTFFDIGDTSLKVGYRFDRQDVVNLLQEYIGEREKEELMEEKLGNFSRSYGYNVPELEKTRRGRARTVTSSQPTVSKEAHADYSHVSLVEKKKSSGFNEDRIVKNVAMPEWVTMIPQMLFDERGLPNIRALRDHFFKEGRLALSCVYRLIRCAKRLFRKEPNVLPLEAPVNVFGDIHGQFYDLLTQLDKLGVPFSDKFDQTLFLGDYVDRGMFSCEVVFYLLALKIRYPNRIHLLRGNHETRNLTEFFNFRIECLRKYNRLVYAMLMDLFDYLPLASIVTNKQGRFFCLHGGLSPSLQYIDEINRIHRIEEVPETGPMCDLLWCDPYRADAYQAAEEPPPPAEGGEGELDGWDSDDSEEVVVQTQTLKAPSATGGDIRFIGNHVRGSGFIFGGAAADQFLDDNKLMMIVRAHEVMSEGYLEYYFGKTDRSHPMVVTVFSAPNYCDMYGNDAAVMCIREDRFEYMVTKSVEHPYYLPDLTNAIHYTFPFIMENLSELMYGAVMFFVAPREDDSEPEPVTKESNKKTLMRLDSLHSMRHSSMNARLNNEKNMVVAKATEAVGGMGGVARFRNAKSFDMANETNPLMMVGGRQSVRSISKLKGLMILDQIKKEQEQRQSEKQAKIKTPSLASISLRKDLAGTSSRDRSFTVSSSLLVLPRGKAEGKEEEKK